jgi:hypothetical protein
VDTKVKGVAGAVTLRGAKKDGGKLSYAVRIEKKGTTYGFAPGGYVSGLVMGAEIRVIDQNKNGVYNDYGQDAMTVGRSTAASFLSRVVSIDGKLYDFTVNAEGTEATVAPYAGEIGRLDFDAGFKCFGDLRSAVVTGKDGVSFNVAGVKGGLAVPTGEYSLVYGLAAKGTESVKIRGGSMKPVTVAASEVASPGWGAPLEVDFSYTLADTKLTVPPALIFHGSAGEEYYDFKPDGQSPKILVIDPAAKEVVLEGRFGGC